MENKHFLDAFVDSTKWKYVKSIWNNIGHLYEHTITHRPLCLTKGGSRHDPTFVGVVIFYRPLDAQINIKMECLPNMAIAMVSTVDEIYSKTSVLNPVQEVAVWNQFAKTYINDMMPRLIMSKEKKPKTKAKKIPVQKTKNSIKKRKTPVRKSAVVVKKKRKPTAKKVEEEKKECSVCMKVKEFKTLTTTSCGHTTVCQICSDRMKNRADAHFRNHCVICRQKLEFVVESNDDIRIIN